MKSVINTILTTLALLFLFFGSAIAQEKADLLEFTTIEERSWSNKLEHDVHRSAININFDVLTSVKARHNSGFILELPGGERAEIEIDNIYMNRLGVWSMYGRVDNAEIGTFSMSIHEDKVLSNLRAYNGNSYQIRFDNNQRGHYLYKIDENVFPPEQCMLHDHETVKSEIRRSRTNEFDRAAITTIDIMIVYTPSARTFANNNFGNIYLASSLSMADLNLASSNSDSRTFYELVRLEQVIYTESANISADLRRLTISEDYNPWGDTYEVTDDDGNVVESYDLEGFMNEVHDWRDESGADLVALFTGSGAPGVAWRPRDGQEDGYPERGFSISHVNAAVTNLTHAHEIGHNMGNAHSRLQTDGVPNDNTLLFDYATGWRWQGTDSNHYVSTMTYHSGQGAYPNAQRVPHFSNPDISFQGTPTGSYTGDGIWADSTFAPPADNARTMREMRHAVASYRDTAPIIKPEITVSADSIHFHVFQLESQTIPITITNTGNDDLRILNWTHDSSISTSFNFIDSSGNDFTPNFTIEPDESAILEVTISSSLNDSGSFYFDIAILSDDFDNPSVNVRARYDIYDHGGLHLAGNGYVHVPHNLSHAVNGEQMTLQFWLKHDGNSEEDAIIITNKTSQGSDGYMARFVGSGEEPHILFAPTSFNNRHLMSTSGIKAGKWYHITLVYNDPNTLIYINGQLDNQNTAVGGRTLRNQNVGIVMGTNIGLSGPFFSGYLDEVRIWRNVLNLAEINENLGRRLTTEELENPLAAYFWFNQTNGSIVREMRTTTVFGTLNGDATLDSPGAFPLPPLIRTVNAPGSDHIHLYAEQPSYAQDGLNRYYVYLTDSDGNTSELMNFSPSVSQPRSLTLPDDQDYLVQVRSQISHGSFNSFMGDYSASAHVRSLDSRGGGALELSGNGYLKLPYRPSLEVRGSELSIEFWVNRLEDESGEQIIISNKRGSNDGYELVFTSGGKQARLQFRPTSFSNRWLTSNGGVKAGEWTHVAVVYSDPVTSIYINGELDATNSASGGRDIRGDRNDLIIGANVELNQRFLRAAIDEFRIWNTNRTLAEIQSTMSDLLIGNEEELVGYWRFDEGNPEFAYGATISSTAELIGDGQTYPNGAFPLPPRVFTEYNHAEEQIELFIEPLPFANDSVTSWVVSRSSANDDIQIIETLDANTLSLLDDEISGTGNLFYTVQAIDDYGSGGGSFALPSPSANLDNEHGTALRFTGNGYVDFQYMPTLDISGDEITVQAWVKIEESAADVMYIIDNRGSGSDGFKLMALKEDEGYKLRFEVTSFGARHLTTNTTLVPDQWYHITATFNDPVTSLYINGALDRTNSASGSRNIRSNPDGYVIGANHSLNMNFFTGDLDAIRIWDRELSSSEAADTYNISLTGNESGLVAYWEMNNTHSNTIWSAADKALIAESFNTQFVPSTILEDDPFRPFLVTPENGAVDQPFPLDFEWSEVDNVNSYTIQISATESFNQVLQQSNLTQNLTTVNSGLKYDSTYYWRVRSHADYFTSQWSPVWSFSMELPLPEPPDWNPADGQVTGSDVLLVWTKSLYAETYDLQVSDNDDFDSPFVEASELSETEFELADLEPGTYFWRVRAENRTGLSDWSETLSFTVTSTSTEPVDEIPNHFALNQNYPNPFNPSTRIEYSLPETTPVRIDVFSVTGSRVATLVNGTQSAGNHSIVFDAHNLASGIYIYRMQAGDFVETRKLTLVK